MARKRGPKNLELRGNTYYYRRMIDGVRVVHSLGTRHLETAEAMARELDRKIELGNLGIPDPVRQSYTFEQAWEEYEQLAVAGNLAATTLQVYQSRWNRFSKLMREKGVSTLDAVTPVMLGKVFAEQSKRLTPRSVNFLFLGGAQTVWKTLLKYEIVDSNPFTALDAQTVNVKDKLKTRYLEWPAIVKLLEVARAYSPDMHLAVILGALGGLRHRELLRARWEHINWETNLFYVDGTKNVSSAAVIPLHPEFRAALEPYRQDSGYIVAPKNEQWPDDPLRYRYQIKWHWAKVVEQAGLEKVTPHALRHSIAQHLYDKGCTLQQVARYIRHANTGTTIRYARVDDVPLFEIPVL